MKKLILSSALILAPLFAQATELKCEYGYAGVSLGTVKFSYDANNIPSEYAEVSLFFAPMQKMPLTNEVPAADEFLRLTISKDDASNELLIMIKKPQGDTIPSILRNSGAPDGAKEMQGLCVASAS
ncbi:hypothetical protein D3C87_1152110 [compost metagenome]